MRPAPVETDFVHWVKGGNLEDARRYGLTIISSCGRIWVPTGESADISERPACPKCEELEGRIIKGAKRPHWVYRCYDADDRLLYVGCTVDLATRRQGHAANAWWFPQMARFRVTVYPNRRSALAVEAAAIAGERPLWNVRSQNFSTWTRIERDQAHDLAVEFGAPETVLKRFARLVRAA